MVFTKPWQPLAVMSLLLPVQFVTNNFVEPRRQHAP
jgi:hypothetical protein